MSLQEENSEDVRSDDTDDVYMDNHPNTNINGATKQAKSYLSCRPGYLFSFESRASEHQDMSLQMENGDEESNYIGDIHLEDQPPGKDDDAADESDARGDDAEQLDALARLFVRICKGRGIAVPFDPGNDPTTFPSSEVLVSDAQDNISAMTDVTGVESAASKGSAAPHRRRRASGLPVIGEDSSAESVGRRPSSGGRRQVHERAGRDRTRRETDRGALDIKDESSSIDARSPLEVEADIEMNVSAVPPTNGESFPLWIRCLILALVTCALVMIALMVALSVSMKEQNVPGEEPWAKLTTPTEKSPIDPADEPDPADTPSSPSNSPSTKLTVAETDERTISSTREPSRARTLCPTPSPLADASSGPSKSSSAKPTVERTAAGKCANTPGYVDAYGDGCGYYEADENFPRACQYFGTSGPNGKTPNENCCACRDYSKRTPPTSSPATSAESSHQPTGKTGDHYESPAAKLVANDGNANDAFGSSLGIDGDTVIVGAYRDDDAGSDSGSVYVFFRDGNANWSQQAKLVADDGKAYGHFGGSIGISGDNVIVGANSVDDIHGSAYVFVRNATNNWPQRAKLVAADHQKARNEFGCSVGIHGETAVVGAHGDYEQKGSAYVFSGNAASSWSLQAKLAASDGAAYEDFGWSVGIYDDTVAAGAPNCGGKGAVYVFVRDGTNRWPQQAKLVANDGEIRDQFGYSVAIYGGTLVVGAYGDDDNKGSAYVFVRGQDDTWTQHAKLVANDRADGDYFGCNVGIYDDTVIVGAYAANDQGRSSGSAYIFAREASNKWTQQVKLIANDGADHDNFGFSVGIHGDAAVAGARHDSDSGHRSGSASIFLL